jgi:cation:H+ antiporter
VPRDNPLLLLVVFLASATVVVLAGTRLARHGDVIAARTRLGGLWVGSLFLAAATSLPELVTDISAVRLGAPDLAAGDLFGSSMANMLILALVNLLPRGGELFQQAALDHVLYAALAISLSCVAAIFILLPTPAAVFGIGPGSAVIVAAYLLASRAIFRHTAIARRTGEVIEMSGAANGATTQAPAPASGAGPALRHAVLGFGVAAVVILVAAPVLAHSAERIAELTGLGSTLVGTWLVGLTTSLPELVTSLAAVRLGSYDLAVGNLFGSNALNMTLFLPLDLASTEGPLLAIVQPAHVLSAMVAVVLMAVALAALVYRARGRLTLLEPSSAIIVLGYLLGLGLLFAAAAPA